jgi:hypothetical protein
MRLSIHGTPKASIFIGISMNFHYKPSILGYPPFLETYGNLHIPTNPPVSSNVMSQNPWELNPTIILTMFHGNQPAKDVLYHPFSRKLVVFSKYQSNFKSNTQKPTIYFDQREQLQETLTLLV